jgi:hypothetical protein
MALGKCYFSPVVLGMLCLSATTVLSKSWSILSAASLGQEKQTSGAASTATQVPSEAPIPEKAGDILLSAALVNGLDAAGLEPWHIVVEYDVFDEDGDNVNDGTYEEFWVGPKQYRVTYTSKDFTQTDIATDHGLYRVGNQAWPGELQTRVRDAFVRPMFRELDLINEKPEKTTREFGQISLPCVQFRSTETSQFTIAISPYGLAASCFEPNSLMLRYIKGGLSPLTVGNEVRYQKIVRFQNHYVADEVQVTRVGKKYLEMHLQKLETIPNARSADFAAPQNAILVGDKIAIDSNVLLLDYLLHMENPKYPQTPGKAGTASVRFLIRKDGHVANVQFVDGPPEMRKPLENALPKFLYRPFFVMGEPVEVETTQSFQYEAH